MRRQARRAYSGKGQSQDRLCRGGQGADGARNKGSNAHGRQFGYGECDSQGGRSQRSYCRRISRRQAACYRVAEDGRQASRCNGWRRSKRRPRPHRRRPRNSNRRRKRRSYGMQRHRASAQRPYGRSKRNLAEPQSTQHYSTRTVLGILLQLCLRNHRYGRVLLYQRL